MDPFACRRCARLAVLVLLVAHPTRAGVDPILIDDFESGDSCLWGVGPETCPGFAVTTPPLLVQPGEEAVFCYYFHTGNPAIQGVRRIVSSMEDKTRYPRLRLRVLLAPGLWLGPGKADLLEGIAETGSISAAGRQMGMSYKRAWGLVEGLNSMFAEPLVALSLIHISEPTRPY